MLGSGGRKDSAHVQKCAQCSLSAHDKFRKCDGEAVLFMVEAKLEHLGRVLVGNVWNLCEEHHQVVL